MPTRQNFSSAVYNTNPAVVFNCIATSQPNLSTYQVTTGDTYSTTTVFRQADQPITTNIGGVFDPTRHSGHHPESDLQHYLSRPVVIAQWTQQVGFGISEEVDPWTALIEQPDIRKRLEGYNLFQAKLHVKITVNGNPMMYGHSFLAYRPRHLENTLFPPLTGSIDAIVSQRWMLPKIMVNPTTSQGGEMVIPFFCPDNWISLVGGTYRQMGILGISAMSQLRNANSATGKVVYTVYAWFEDVVLGAPCTEDYRTYTAQAGDEYSRPALSSVASTVAKVAGMLSEIPYIGPFARASEMVATTVGNMASFFGYSRPLVLTDAHIIRARTTGGLSITNDKDTSRKLALDNRQELSIDSRTAGLAGIDEMDFAFIAKKEGLLNINNVTEADPPGKSILAIAVTPMHWELVSDGPGIPGSFLVTPVTTVAIPFKYWRGSLKYRFLIDASAFHRCKLKFVYTPTFRIEDRANPPALNRCFTRIVDIAEHKDFTLTVGWHSHRSWLETYDPKFGDFITNTDMQQQDWYHREGSNGVIHIYLVDSLTSPNPSLNNPITIYPIVSAGDDFEVACPDNRLLSQLEYTSFPRFGVGVAPPPPSGANVDVIEESSNGVSSLTSPDPTSVTAFPSEMGFVPEDGEVTAQAGDELVADQSQTMPEESAPLEDVVTSVSGDHHLNLVHMGETIKSARALLKRFCFHTAFELNSNSSFADYNFPVYKGQVGETRHGPRNQVGMTYINYFAPCFAGWRGGIRHKIVNNYAQGTLFVKRTNPLGITPVGFGFVNTVTLPPGGVFPNASRSEAVLRQYGGGAGCEIASTPHEGALEIEFPYQTWKRFTTTGQRFPSFNPVMSNPQGLDTHYLYAIGVHENGSGDNSIRITTRFVAAADDFSLFFWIGQPVLRFTPPDAYDRSFAGTEP